jgi:hypothetical protein
MGKWKSMAFPNGMITDDRGVIVSSQAGMELRDYFAAKAMHALIINSNTNGYINDILHVAYRYADGAIDAREQE